MRPHCVAGGGDIVEVRARMVTESEISMPDSRVERVNANMQLNPLMVRVGTMPQTPLLHPALSLVRGQS